MSLTQSAREEMKRGGTSGLGGFYIALRKAQRANVKNIRVNGYFALPPTSTVSGCPVACCNAESSRICV